MVINMYCSVCKKRKVIAKGLCRKCYHKQYHKLYYAKNKEKMYKYIKQYYYDNIGQPMSENKECSSYLGMHIAEQVLSKIFKDVEIMPINNTGYDFTCNKGMKIDVKSSTVDMSGRSLGRWAFVIKRNIIADYFLCLAFDNRKNLNPLHIWLLPSKYVNHLTKISISKSTINKWDEYRLDINKVISCCNTMKGD